MNSFSFLEKYKNRRILFTPLNWGLGHATRSIPLIRQLQKNNKIFIGSDGSSLKLLQNQFPDCQFKSLPPYKIKYGERSFIWSMIGQSPKISLAISLEMAVTEELVDENSIDLIISDHRFGCRDERCESIIMAHQIQIKSTSGLFGSLGSRLNKYFINFFDECWIPDYENRTLSLSGELSSHQGLKNYRYIGPLSRLKKLERNQDLDILLLLSGPEPSRSKLETRLIEILELTPYRICLVRGADNGMEITPKFIKTISLANVATLNELLARSRIAIARSGYSTIMDIINLRKSAILIPTPGQPEQEYLGTYGHERGFFTCLTEDKLSEKLVEMIGQLLN